MSLRILLSTLAFSTAATAVSLADEVVFTNGDRLAGTIVRLTDAKIVLKTDLLGEVSFAAGSVRTFSTDAPLELHLADGTVIRAPAEAAEPGAIRLREAGAPSPRTVRLEDVAAINPPVAGVKWSGSATVGVTVTRGNSDTESASVSAEAVRRAEDDRWTAQANYLAARQDERDDDDPTTEEGRTTTQRVMSGSLKYDYFVSKRIYAYAGAKGEKDRLADLRLRFNASTGAGVQWVETDEVNLSSEAGVGWLAEYFEDGSENGTMSGRFAYALTKQFGEAVRLFHNFEGLHGFDDPHDFLVQTDAGLRSSLTKSMFSEVKVVLNWDSTPASDADRTDVRYILGVGLKF